MRLVNFDHHGKRHVGLLVGEEVLDLTAALGDGLDDAAKFIAAGETARAQARRYMNSTAPRFPIATVRLCAPITEPSKIFGVGMSYGSFVTAARRLGMPIPPHKPWFQRPRACITGPFSDIWLPPGCAELDYEGELAVIIGRRCRNVSAPEAQGVIGGFTCANDLTLRERAKQSLALSKAYDTHTPLGPCIVTADEIGNPVNLALRTWVNGQLRQQSTTLDLMIGIEELIAELSEVCTLEPGDIILTGTPDGCGIFQQPPTSLAVGDLVGVEIEGIGRIQNRVIHAPALPGD